MTTTKYLIKLTPTGDFFFGQRKRSDFGNQQNYHVKSSRFPQQTQVLGMVQTQLLLRKGMIAIGSTKRASGKDVERLIGKPFDIQEKENTTYGQIKSISPIFIIDNDRHYLLSAKYSRIHIEYELLGGKKCKKSSNAQLIKQSGVGKSQSLWGTYRTESRYQIQRFNHKLGFADELVNASSQNSYTSAKDIFLEESHAHNNKAMRQLDDTKGFFKISAFRMKPKYAFGFILELSDNIDKDLILQNDMVKLGGKSGLFHWTANEWTEDKIPSEQSEKSDSNTILLTSDAFVKEGYQQHCKFVTGNTTEFLYINRKENNDGKMFNLDPKKSFSNTQIILEKGTVLYLKDNTDLDDVFQAYTNYKSNNKTKPKHSVFTAIGYNHFLRI